MNLTSKVTASIESEWHPNACYHCGRTFDERWLSHYSPLGELTWKCPQCEILHARTLSALTRDFVSTQLAEDYMYPKNGDFPHTKVVQQSALAKIDSIRDHAHSLGWNDSRLYQNRGQLRFPYSDDYGLVCLIYNKVERLYDGYIVRSRQIGEVTRQRIEIICNNYAIRRHTDHKTGQDCCTRHLAPDKPHLFFDNPDVDQPWIKRRT